MNPHAPPSVDTSTALWESRLPQASWLEALPHACALISLNGNAIQISTSNMIFLRAMGSWPDNEPVETALTRACRNVLSGSLPGSTLTWEQGGFSGRVYEATISPLNGEDAEPLALLSLVDHTTLIRSEANLRRELLSDSLTGLPNRSGFGDVLEARLRHAPPPGQTLTLLIVDLARFSRINESIGALAGDELLITVARRLRQQTRGSDVLARIGSDEFAILSQTRPAEDGARTLADRMRAVFRDPFRIGELLINVDCAVGGIAALSPPAPDEEPDAPELIRHAQIALKQAKRGEGVAFYEPVALARLHKRFDREHALRQAIDHDDIGLAFQPLVDMKNRRVIGFEALARWTHEGEPISPGEFVPIAEDSGLILPLGRLVIDKAAATLARWDERLGKPMPVGISVNVSPIQLARDDIITVVQHALERHQIDGRRLIIEVTESSVVRNPDTADAILRALTDLDVRIAMDDFGTGYSNIASLQRLPIHTLKIDRSLVAGIDTSADSLAIVRTIQRLAEALGLRTTAEGIETETVAQQVAAIGCDVGQGFLFSRPLDPDAAFDAWQRSQGR
ncbi:bifunctional diguanylate cyclase/phosphodiesterase [Sphingomonas lacunae]|uniref:Bifunctional diguanylate cyclase/phosphodiesterase n=1 Tax=Sphingomonas lacunae TaxID=2698828 RepID=A0A6M4ARE8_9SPHN|nr:bifunctional diguanylate cyclase/phosphodiesterase [Sphingomonas lacunae]QJQ31638.1 bifunctional diguanylate cyclase/phosphodiesterase [Sphingomonas lacunae]